MSAAPPAPATRAAKAAPKPAARAHVAVVKPRYLATILDGRKTIECRLTRTRREPLGAVHRGDTIYFKAPGRAASVIATARRVTTHRDLTPAALRAIKAQHNTAILAPKTFWQSRQTARYATLIWLTSAREANASDNVPSVPPLYGRGWQVIRNT